MTRQEAGFTLVELLVVLVAGSLLLVSLSWVLQGSARDFRGAVSSEAKPLTERNLGRLRTLVEQALPAPIATDPLGASGPVYFVPAPETLGVAGPVRMELSVSSQNGKQDLIARFAPTQDTSVQFPPMEAALLQGMSKLALDLDEVTNPRLPAPLRIRYEDDGAEQTLVIRPRVTADRTCQFDPISLTCRQ
jgi:prepilin-type N-terminal cleavage/methylation domain-containing protein